MQIVLFEPQIPPNTGSIARLCAATQTPLHLIEPLGFSLEDRYLKRAGLDYWPSVNLRIWPNWNTFQDSIINKSGSIVITSSKAVNSLFSFSFNGQENLVFGPESKGLPHWFFNQFPLQIQIPIWGQVRSLNLSNAAAICLYEAYRQTIALNNKLS
ncbi:MAG TPA: tRNA (cytidine(34)-2'-O)-methyltransferase [Desulfohalobiaceae bacterium]|nr:tRNA (cytidine(34)-2'-O)-methyltransferase [Desulfohalobiaceae bacterium]